MRFYAPVGHLRRNGNATVKTFSSNGNNHISMISSRKRPSQTSFTSQRSQSSESCLDGSDEIQSPTSDVDYTTFGQASYNNTTAYLCNNFANDDNSNMCNINENDRNSVRSLECNSNKSLIDEEGECHSQASCHRFIPLDFYCSISNLLIDRFVILFILFEYRQSVYGHRLRCKSLHHKNQLNHANVNLYHLRRHRVPTHAALSIQIIQDSSIWPTRYPNISSSIIICRPTAVACRTAMCPSLRARRIWMVTSRKTTAIHFVMAIPETII